MIQEKDNFHLQQAMGYIRAVCFIVLCSFVLLSHADLPPEPKHPELDQFILQAKPISEAVIVPSAPKLNLKSYVLLAPESGAILAQQSINKRIEPASLTKIMTLYVAFYALEQGHVHLTDKVHISPYAWHAVGSRMFLRVNHYVALSLLIQGIVVDSGNDASIALAEYIAGSEKAFVELMNQTAQQLGMLNSHFDNVTGLPDPKHYTTAHDLAVLTQALMKDYPQHYHWFKQRYLTHNKIKQSNRNRLLWQDLGVDGLKTGHTQSAGYCLVASATRDSTRLVGVIIGAATNSARFLAARSLLDYGFRFYQTKKIHVAQEEIVRPRVWFGRTDTVSLGLSDDWFITPMRSQIKGLKPEIQVNNPLKAPIQKGKTYGTISIKVGKDKTLSRPLIALASVKKGSVWHRFTDHIRLLWH